MNTGTNMTNDEFEMTLKKVELTKKEFARLVEMSYGGVVNWGRSTQTIPSWVESWLGLYIKNRKFENLKKSIKDSGACS
jgi:DNA-binding transcriptional regulator YiaG